MSKQEKPYWYVTVELDYAAKEYRGVNVVKAGNVAGGVTSDRTPYVLVQADDEIGAFNEAQKILNRLRFRVGA